MFDITSAQIHLAVNHLPVFAALFSSATLAFAAVTRRASARNLGLGLMAVAALSALPAYFSGEGAEEIVEDRPGVSESLIERHEEAAASALAVTVAAGALSSAALLLVGLQREKTVRIVFPIALLLALASTVLMARVAHLGGQIRHDEIRSASAGKVLLPSSGRSRRGDD